MASIHFLYGNQSLEIEEASNDLIKALLGDTTKEDGLYAYDAEGFFGAESGRVNKLIDEFQNRCETISFFATKIVIQLKNLERLPFKKSPTEDMEKALGEVNLIKMQDDDDLNWYDMDSLSEHIDTRHHLTGKNIIEEVIPLGGKVFHLNLKHNWKNRIVYKASGKNKEGIEIQEFLKSRLKFDIRFDRPQEDPPAPVTDSGRMLNLLKSYISNPPDHIHFVFSANIRNTRELNKEISNLLLKKATVKKLTIAYDDFNPVDWVVDRARKKDLYLDRSSAALLIEIAGSEYSVLDMELNKLSILTPRNSKISPADLLKNTSNSKKFSIFRVANFLVQKDIKNTFQSLESVLKNHPADAVSVFSLIASQFRRLLSIAWMIEAGIPENIIVSKLKINKWIAEQAIQHSQNFSGKELENIVIQLAKNDLQLKYNMKDALIILETLCFQICQGVFKDKDHIDSRWAPHI